MYAYLVLNVPKILWTLHNYIYITVFIIASIIPEISEVAHLLYRLSIYLHEEKLFMTYWTNLIETRFSNVDSVSSLISKSLANKSTFRSLTRHISNEGSLDRQIKF